MDQLKEHDLGLQTTHGVKFKGQTQTVERAENTKEQPPRCPLLHCLCGENCALYDAGKCAIVTGAGVKTGGRCPFNGSNSGRRCVPNCPLKDGEKCGLCAAKKGVL